MAARRSDPDATENRRRLVAALHDHLVAHINEAPNVDVLVELGCGSGVLTLMLARARPETRIIGMDPSTDRLRKAAAAAADLGVLGRVEFERADLVTLPLPDGATSLLVGAEVLTRSSNGRVLISEIARILRPGGSAVLLETAPLPGSSTSRKGTLVPSLQRPGADEGALRSLIENSPLKGQGTLTRHSCGPDESFLEISLTRAIPPERKPTSWRTE